MTRSHNRVTPPRQHRAWDSVVMPRSSQGAANLRRGNALQIRCYPLRPIQAALGPMPRPGRASGKAGRRSTPASRRHQRRTARTGRTASDRDAIDGGFSGDRLPTHASPPSSTCAAGCLVPARRGRAPRKHHVPSATPGASSTGEPTITSTAITRSPVSGKSEMRSTLTFNSKSPDQGRAFRRGP
jgi:hypothetical protein